VKENKYMYLEQKCKRFEGPVKIRKENKILNSKI
jgi:hypothetical protein